MMDGTSSDYWKLGGMSTRGAFICGKCGAAVEPAAACPSCKFTFGTVEARSSSHRAGGFLGNAARIGAYVSVGAALLGVSLSLGSPHVGFENALVLAGVAGWLSILCGTVSLASSAVLKFKGKSVGAAPTIMSLCAIGLITAPVFLQP